MKVLALFLFVCSASAFSHSGGTDSNGCHHETRTGGFHCHKSDDAKKSVERGPANTKMDEQKAVKLELSHKKEASK